MKKRSRVGHNRSQANRRGAHAFFNGPRPRQRSGFTFEQLEDRFCFSASPLNLQTVSISNDTAEGAAALWMRELGWAALQSVGASAADRDYAVRQLPNDVFFPNQWHLLNVGQETGNPDYQTIFGVAGEDINVLPVWESGYTGKGILIQVNDSGVETDHPDLAANIHPTLQFNAINGGSDPTPDLLDPTSGHGTSIAGLIAAVTNNGIGVAGVAPGAQIVPVLLIGAGTTDQSIADAFGFATRNGIDITNNSWGPADIRVTDAIAPLVLQSLRDTINFGRGGLGIINVWAAGNGAGPGFAEGFTSIGTLDSANYDGYQNSRYVVSVTGVDHDGLYVNEDGTFTAYPEAGSGVLVAAPTGSVFTDVADDAGVGSGLWTTDLVGDFGSNMDPLPSGFDPDRDFAPDPDYTSRANGTSAAAPLVSGVVALMLEANPNLTYRDVQEILVRSARQNAQFEVPSSGGLSALKNTWITNQIGVFRNPDPWVDAMTTPPLESVYFPTMDPNLGSGRAGGHFESNPSILTNGAGYTVSQGYGVYSESIGFAHGVVDADLAVKMAEQWHVLDQDVGPRTEKTFTTFVVNTALRLGPAEKMDDEFGALLVPGAIGTDPDGFIDYWNEYFADDDPDDPDDGPFSDYDGPTELSRGLSSLSFAVPDDQSMSIEYAEVKVSIEGPTDDLDHLRIMLVSPEGTVSELNHYYEDGDFIPYGIQLDTFGSSMSGDGMLDPDGGNFVWTFSTNRNWGERTNTAVITDPVTGEPLLQEFMGTPLGVLSRNWELYIENWSNSEFILDAVEIVWHGKPIAAGTQRIQGFVGLDTNADEAFNYSRHVQSVFGDPAALRLGNVVRQVDLTQEPFASNVVVAAYRVENGVVDDNPVARFITGHDGNYYFDLAPDEYVIRISDPLSRPLLEDIDTDPMFMQHFKQEWHITPDWFFAPDRDDPSATGEIGEILWDPLTDAPQKFEIAGGQGPPQTVPMGVKHLNFLIKQATPASEVVVNGTVFADLNANGIFDGDDTTLGGVFVFADTNRNGVRDSGEQTVTTSTDVTTRGQYTMTLAADRPQTLAVGVIPPTVEWITTNPADGLHDIFAGPGDIRSNINFFLNPPNNPNPPDGGDRPGQIVGVVFNDSDGDGVRDLDEVGVPGFRVYIDANRNGVFDSGEVAAITSGLSGSYSFENLPAGTHRIEVEIPDEESEDSEWELVAPELGYHEITIGAGGFARNIQFALVNHADRDWGDLPSSYITRADDSAGGGPSHVIIPGFHLGKNNDGETNGRPTPNADGDDADGGDDDGVRVRSNDGFLQLGPNILDVELVGVGGYLNGWIDFNGDGTFDLGEQVITDVHLNPGTRQVTVTLPPRTVDGPLAARFRWGPAGLAFDGPAGIGEVEDYFLPSSVTPSVALAGDYDLNGTVDNADLGVWRATFGTSDLRGDGNGDGAVDLADWVVWKKNLGATSGTGSATSSSLGLSAGAAEPAGIVSRGSAGHRVDTSTLGAGLADVALAAESGSSPFLLEPVMVGLPSDELRGSRVAHASLDVVGSTATSSTTANASLLLLDQAWAELNGDAASARADDVWTNVCDWEESLTELALAAVLEDNLWSSL